MRYLLLIITAVGLSGCVTLDGFGAQVTTAQAQYLAAQDARAAREAEAQRHLVDRIAEIAQTGDQTSRVVALMMLDRVANGMPQRAVQAVAQPQEGPITTALRVAAPFVLPLAQIWQADRAGKRALDQALGNMDLIGAVAGQIQRDPLVVTTPAPSVINAPPPMVLTTPPPVIVERPAPIILDQPIVVPVAGG